MVFSKSKKLSKCSNVCFAVCLQFLNVLVSFGELFESAFKLFFELFTEVVEGCEVFEGLKIIYF